MATIEDEQTETAEEGTVSPSEPLEGADDTQPADGAEGAETAAGAAARAESEGGDAAQELEKKLKKLVVSRNTWVRRVGEVLEEAANDLVPCELCIPEIPGFHYPVEIMVAETELEDRLIRALRGAGSVDYVASATLKQCETCKGHGQVLTGSLVPDNELARCTDCLGYGFTPPPTPGAQTAGGQDAAQVVLSAAAAPPAEPEIDLWGSPRLLETGAENPNYGRAPQYKSPSLP